MILLDHLKNMIQELKDNIDIAMGPASSAPSPLSLAPAASSSASSTSLKREKAFQGCLKEAIEVFNILNYGGAGSNRISIDDLIKTMLSQFSGAEFEIQLQAKLQERIVKAMKFLYLVLKETSKRSKFFNPHLPPDSKIYLQMLRDRLLEMRLMQIAWIFSYPTELAVESAQRYENENYVQLVRAIRLWQAKEDSIVGSSFASSSSSSSASNATNSSQQGSNEYHLAEISEDIERKIQTKHFDPQEKNIIYVKPGSNGLEYYSYITKKMERIEKTELEGDQDTSEFIKIKAFEEDVLSIAAEKGHIETNYQEIAFADYKRLICIDHKLYSDQSNKTIRVAIKELVDKARYDLSHNHKKLCQWLGRNGGQSLALQIVPYLFFSNHFGENYQSSLTRTIGPNWFVNESKKLQLNFDFSVSRVAYMGGARESMILAPKGCKLILTSRLPQAEVMGFDHSFIWVGEKGLYYCEKGKMAPVTIYDWEQFNRDLVQIREANKEMVKKVMVDEVGEVEMMPLDGGEVIKLIVSNSEHAGLGYQLKKGGDRLKKTDSPLVILHAQVKLVLDFVGEQIVPQIKMLDIISYTHDLQSPQRLIKKPTQAPVQLPK